MVIHDGLINSLHNYILKYKTLFQNKYFVSTILFRTPLFAVQQSSIILRSPPNFLNEFFFNISRFSIAATIHSLRYVMGFYNSKLFGSLLEVVPTLYLLYRIEGSEQYTTVSYTNIIIILSHFFFRRLVTNGNVIISLIYISSSVFSLHSGTLLSFLKVHLQQFIQIGI